MKNTRQRYDMENIILRPWSLEDTETLVSLFNNITIWNNMRDYVPHPYTTVDAEVFINAQLDINPAINFAIIDGDLLVGGIGIVLKSDVYRMNVEVAYWIGEPFQGKGIATEAVRQMTAYVFQSFVVNRVVAEVFEYNKPSMRVLEKNGYFLETVSRKGILKNEFLYDNYIWVCQKIF